MQDLRRQLKMLLIFNWRRKSCDPFCFSYTFFEETQEIVTNGDTSPFCNDCLLRTYTITIDCINCDIRIANRNSYSYSFKAQFLYRVFSYGPVP